MDEMDFTRIDDSSDESTIVFHRKRPRLMILSSSPKENNNDIYDCEESDSDKYTTVSEKSHEETEWQQVTGRSSLIYQYMEDEEFLHGNVNCDDPFSLYQLFLSDNLLELIVKETNRYAEQSNVGVENSSSSTTRKHQLSWMPLTIGEIKKFIGILIIMGQVRLPEIKLYWSKQTMYSNARIKKVMKRDRFLSILKYLHFSDNKAAIIDDRVVKIRNIVKIIVDSFKNAVKPGKNIVIDESMIPWRGRLMFRQYIPGKRHKYGIKLYKLCLTGGYTYNVEIYTGKTVNSATKGHAHDVVMRLMNELLFEGRTLYTDSYYTSVPLAEELLDKSTNLCGTVKVNRKFLPVEAKLKQKRGDIVSVENSKGVKFFKWTDKRSVCMLTTSNNHTCTIIEGTSGKLKPDPIFDYNNAKKGVDISDQIASYYNSLRKTIKWYRKIIIELICATSIVNAWYMHQKWGTKRFDILQFRENIIDRLLDEMPTEPQNLNPKRGTTHFLQKYPGTARKSRKRCRECYKNLSARRGRTIAAKKSKRVTTFCRFCEGEPPLCLKCFEKTHKNK